MWRIWFRDNARPANDLGQGTVEWIVAAAVIIVVAVPLYSLSSGLKTDTALQVCRVANAAEECGPTGPGTGGEGGEDGTGIPPAIVYEVEPIVQLEVELPVDPNCQYDNADRSDYCPPITETGHYDPTLTVTSPIIDFDENTPIVQHPEPACEPRLSTTVQNTILVDLQIGDNTPEVLPDPWEIIGMPPLPGTEPKPGNEPKPGPRMTRVKIGSGASMGFAENSDGSVTVTLGASVEAGSGRTKTVYPVTGGRDFGDFDRLLGMLGWSGIFYSNIVDLDAKMDWTFASEEEAIDFAAEVEARHAADVQRMLDYAQDKLGLGAAEAARVVMDFIDTYDGIHQLVIAHELMNPNSARLSGDYKRSATFMAAMNGLGVGQVGGSFDRGITVSMSNIGTPDERAAVMVKPFDVQVDGRYGLNLPDFVPQEIRDLVEASMQLGYGAELEIGIEHKTSITMEDIASGNVLTNDMGRIVVKFKGLMKDGKPVLQNSHGAGNSELNYYLRDWLLENGAVETDFEFSIPIHGVYGLPLDPQGLADQIRMKITQSKSDNTQEAYFNGYQFALDRLLKEKLGRKSGPGTNTLFFETWDNQSTGEQIKVDIPFLEWIRIAGIGHEAAFDIEHERWNQYRVCSKMSSNPGSVHLPGYPVGP